MHIQVYDIANGGAEIRLFATHPRHGDITGRTLRVKASLAKRFRPSRTKARKLKVDDHWRLGRTKNLELIGPTAATLLHQAAEQALLERTGEAEIWHPGHVITFCCDAPLRLEEYARQAK